MRKVHIRPKDAMLLLLFIVFATPIPAEAEDGLALVEAPQVPIDPATKAGSAVLQLKNGGNADVSVSLVVSEFRSKITGQLLSAKVTFSLQPEVPGKPVFPQVLQPGNMLVIKIDVSNVTEAGESAATIFQDGTSLGVLTAVNHHPPFGVRPSGVGDKAELSLQRGARASLTLKNEDAVSYPVSWRLIVNGVSYDGKTAVTLPPNEAMPVEIDPPGAWFEHWAEGLFKADDQDGVLTLAFTRSDGDTRLWPSKSVPLKVHLNYWSPWVRQVFGNAALLFVLIAGGVSSLFVNADLPNRLRRAAADEKLAAVAKRISCISSKIDSRLRVLIRVERLRLNNLLKGRWHISPDFGDALAELNEGIAALTSRVDAAERIDSERHRFDELRGKVPPTLLSRIDDDLQRGADLIRKARPSQADIDLAKTSISKASDLISRCAELVSGEAQDDEFVKGLARRHAYLRDGFKSLEPTEVYTRFQSHVPGPFELLAEDFPKPDNISPRDYIALDTDLAKLAVILDYIRLHKARSPNLQEELQEQDGPERRIMDLVIAMSWECLRAAQLLVRQVQCGIYEKDLRDQLPHGVSIELDRQITRVNEPIEFSLRFHRPVLDRTAAREEWSYTWDFNDKHKERGWSAWHYYPDVMKREVSVQFVDAKANRSKAKPTRRSI